MANSRVTVVGISFLETYIFLMWLQKAQHECNSDHSTRVETGREMSKVKNTSTPFSCMGPLIHYNFETLSACELMISQNHYLYIIVAISIQV